MVLDALRDAARPHGLTFGPDPSTHNRCTLGGMIGNNACGSHSVAWGKTVDNVAALDVLTYRGERLHASGRGRRRPVPDGCARWRDRVGDGVRAGVPRPHPPGLGLQPRPAAAGERVRPGPALVGTEGTCATMLEATVRLVESPPVRALAVLGFPDAYTAADHVMAVRALGPLTIEGMDAGLIAALRAHQPGRDARRGCCPRAAAGSTSRPAAPPGPRPRPPRSAVVAAMRAVRATVAGRRATRRAMQALWRIREDGAGIVTRAPDGGEAWPGWEDAAVPPERFGAYLREFDALLAPARPPRAPTTATSATAACTSASTSTCSRRPGSPNFRAFMEDAADLVVAHGGSLSGEHGDGAARAELLPRMYPPEIIDGVRGVQGHLGPGRPDEPRPRRAARASWTTTCGCSSGCRPCRDTPQLAFAHDRGCVHPRHPPLPRRRASASPRTAG